MNSAPKSQESGYILFAVILLAALSLMVTANTLNSTATYAKTHSAVAKHANYYYSVEQTHAKLVTWLQQNSKNLVSAFTSANFSSNFDISTPSLGDNEGENFGVPTMVKMKGTNDSVMLSNNEFFGQSAFPTTQHIDSGATFSAISTFQSQDFGEPNARVLLVWVRETEGHYEPIFRIDIVTGNNPDRGVHSFSYVYSQLVTEESGGGGAGLAVNFHSETLPFTTKNANNKCWSYVWTYSGGVWSKGAQRSNCVITSNSTITLESQINGSVYSNLTNGISVNHPNGAISGTECEAPGCHTMSLAAEPTWADTCTGNSQGNLTISANTSLASGPALNNQCWDTVFINSGRTLTLTDSTNPYRFRSLGFQNNSNSKLKFPTLAAGSKVTIYVDQLANGSVNGNQFVNTNNSPAQVDIIVTNTPTFKLNGTAEIRGNFVAPVSPVEVLGNFVFHGAIKANKIDITGSGVFNADENLATITLGVPTTTVADMTFSMRKASQRYR